MTHTTRSVRRFVALLASALIGGVLSQAAVAPAHAAPTPLNGLFQLTPGSWVGTASTGHVEGTYFRMAQPDGATFLENGDSRAANKTYTILNPGTDGGLRTGTYQPTPSPAFDSGGNALSGKVTAPESFFGVKFSTATNSVDPQTSQAATAPTISVDGTTLTGDLRAFAASWNNQHFNQGSPKPDGSSPAGTTAVSGTYNPTTKAFHVTWRSKIVGGPFNNFIGEWHLVGTFVSNPAPTFGPVTQTTSGFSFAITNYAGDTTYAVETTAGTATRTDGTVTVSGLNPGDSATVTVKASKDGSDASGQVTSAAVFQGAVPTFSSYKRTSTGFTLTISNYDAAVSYVLATSAGKVTRSTSKLTISGLKPGKSAKVTVTAKRTGYTTEKASYTGTALKTGTAPKLSAATKIPKGFTVKITNYTSKVTYALKTSAGKVKRSGAKVTVYKLAKGKRAKVTVTAKRSGYTNKSASKTGTAG